MNYTIGVDIGGTNIAVGIVDENKKIIARGSVPTNAKRPYDDIIADAGALVQRVLEQSGVTVSQCRYMGVGAPGVLDNEKGTVTDNSNIHWVDYPIADKFRQYIDLPVFLGNDANVAAWAEFVGGSGKGSDNFVMMTLGTGVGGGIVINGRLITGSHNRGAEIGHIMLKSGGRKCGCGNYGCIECYCSATALIRRARSIVNNYPQSEIAKAEEISAKTVLDAAKNEDALGKMLFDEYVDYLAQAIAGVINFLDPDIIALGGGVANAGEFLLVPVRKKVLEYVTFLGEGFTEIVSAVMGNDAGIIGAASLGE